MVAKILIYFGVLLAPVIPGYLLITSFQNGYTLVFRLLSGWLLGSAVTTAGLFGAMLLGLVFGPGTIFFVFFLLTVITAVVFFVSKKRRILKNKQAKPPLISSAKKCFVTLALILVGGALLVTYLLLSLSKGPIDFSNLANYGLKAKALVIQKALPLDLLTAPDFYYAQQGYPWFLPLLIAQGQVFSRVSTGEAVLGTNLLAPMLGVFLFLLLYAGWSQTLGPNLTAVAGAFVLAANTTFFFAASNLYAELVLNLAALSGLFLLFYYFEDKHPSDLVMGLVFVGACGWIKNEGLLLWFLVAVLLLLAALKGAINRKAFLLGLGLSLIFIVPWLIYRELFALPTGDFDFNKVPTWAKIKETFNYITPVFWQRVFKNPLNFNALWLITPAILLLHLPKIRRCGGSRFLLLVGVLLTLGYVAVYFFSNISLRSHLKALNRTLLLPTNIFFWVAVLSFGNKTTPNISFWPPARLF